MGAGIAVPILLSWMIAFALKIHYATIWGPIAAFSFGPTMRFVCGADHAAPLLARALADAAPRRTVAVRADRAERQMK